MTDKMLWVKIWHWTNGALCIFLIVTGLHMQYSGFGMTFISFEKSVALHNICGVMLTVSFLGFIIGNIKSKNYKNYKVLKSDLLKDIWIQVRYYAFGIFKGEKEPFPVGEEREFNPLQKISYAVIMYCCLPVIIITGIAMLFPELIPNRIFSISGFLLTDLFHVVFAFAISIFLLIHIYFAYFHGFHKK